MFDFSKHAVEDVLSQEQKEAERFLGVKDRKCEYHSSNVSFS